MNHIPVTCHTILFAFILTVKLTAQDPFFSQYQQSNIYLNPAISGLFNGHYKVQIHYRDQWGSILGANPFRTAGFATELRFQGIGEDYWTVNFQALTDRSGKIHYDQKSIHMGAGYQKLLGRIGREGSQYLLGGIQIGVGQNTADWERLWFGRQFDIDRQVLDRSLSNGEQLTFEGNNNTGIFPNLNLGLMWFASMKNRHSLYGGISIHHLNQANISLLESAKSLENLRIKWGGQFGAELPLNESLSIMPAIYILIQGPSYKLNIGNSFRFQIPDEEIAIRIGVGGRISNAIESVILDAVIFQVGLDHKNWSGGISYDFSSSDLSNFNNGQGAIEIVLAYKHSIEERRYRKVIYPNL